MRGLEFGAEGGSCGAGVGRMGLDVYPTFIALGHSKIPKILK